MATVTQPAIVTPRMWEWVSTLAVVMVTDLAISAGMAGDMAILVATGAVMVEATAVVMVEAMAVTAVVITKSDAIRNPVIRSGGAIRPLLLLFNEIGCSHGSLL